MSFSGRVEDVTGVISDENAVVRTIQRSLVNATSSGNTAAVAAQASLRIRVLAVAVISGSAITVKFQSDTTDICAGFPLAVNGGFVLPRNQDGWFQTAVGEVLNINLSGNATVGCQVVWITVA